MRYGWPARGKRAIFLSRGNGRSQKGQLRGEVEPGRMRAVILAAGLGSRMLPHTESRPKCLLKIGGHSILEYQLAALRQCGISDVVIVLGHQGDKIRAHLNVPA